MGMRLLRWFVPEMPLDARVKKAVMKRTADALEKIAIAGIALGMFQGKTGGIWIAGAFLAASYLFTIGEAKT